MSVESEVEREEIPGLDGMKVGGVVKPPWIALRSRIKGAWICSWEDLVQLKPPEMKAAVRRIGCESLG